MPVRKILDGLSQLQPGGNLPHLGPLLRPVELPIEIVECVDDGHVPFARAHFAVRRPIILCQLCALLLCDLAKVAEVGLVSEDQGGDLVEVTTGFKDETFEFMEVDKAGSVGDRKYEHEGICTTHLLYSSLAFKVLRI